MLKLRIKSLNKKAKLIDQLIYACQSPCATCQTTTTYCLTCIDTFLEADAGICKCKDPNASYEASDNACVCNPKYFESNDICASCNTECATCDIIASNCTSCADGYFNQDDLCIACSSPCATCSESATTCLSCDDPNNMVLSGGVCGCKSSHATFDPTQKICVCDIGYYLDATNICQPCINPCQTCIGSGTVCESCVPGYFLENGNTECTKCESPCETCTGTAETCNSCVDPIDLKLVDNTCVCNDKNAEFNVTSGSCECDPGFYSSNNNCVACAVGCEDCDSKGDCNECSIGYYLNKNEVCVACASGCEECGSATTCEKCIDQHNTKLANGICTCITAKATFNTEGMCECQDGLFNNTETDTCVSCPSNCEVCTSANECNQCWDPTMTKSATGACACSFQNQYFNETTHLCECPSHQYLNAASKQCSACGEGCDICTDAKTCETCFDPDHMTNNQDGTCNCTSSKQEFSEKNERCRDTDSGAYDLTFTWILLVISIALSAF